MTITGLPNDTSWQVCLISSSVLARIWTPWILLVS
jgi:hypothetical protein